MALAMHVVETEDGVGRTERPRPMAGRVEQVHVLRTEPPPVAAEPEWIAARVLTVDRVEHGMTYLELRLPDGSECVPGDDYMIRVPLLDGFLALQCAYGAASGGPTPSSTLELFFRAATGSVPAAALNELLRPGDLLEVQGPAELFAGSPGPGSSA